LVITPLNDALLIIFVIQCKIFWEDVHSLGENKTMKTYCDMKPESRNIPLLANGSLTQVSAATDKNRITEEF
jgi:hypothetical protein